MRLSEYLIENEEAAVEIGASRNASGGSAAGKLACTPYRLVYADPNGVTDISLKGINSIEYTGEKYPSEYLAWGIFSLFVGIGIAVVYELLPQIEAVPNPVLYATILVPVGIGTTLLIQAYFMKQESLEVNTANDTFKFYSGEGGLAEIAHTVRGYEMKN